MKRKYFAIIFFFLFAVVMAFLAWFVIAGCHPASPCAPGTLCPLVVDCDGPRPWDMFYTSPIAWLGWASLAVGLFILKKQE